LSSVQSLGHDSTSSSTSSSTPSSSKGSVEGSTAISGDTNSTADEEVARTKNRWSVVKTEMVSTIEEEIKEVIQRNEEDDDGDATAKPLTEEGSSLTQIKKGKGKKDKKDKKKKNKKKRAESVVLPTPATIIKQPKTITKTIYNDIDLLQDSKNNSQNNHIFVLPTEGVLRITIEMAIKDVIVAESDTSSSSSSDSDEDIDNDTKDVGSIQYRRRKEKKRKENEMEKEKERNIENERRKDMEIQRKIERKKALNGDHVEKGVDNIDILTNGILGRKNMDEKTNNSKHTKTKTKKHVHENFVWKNIERRNIANTFWISLGRKIDLPKRLTNVKETSGSFK
jgi:hypothetical protein